MLIGSEFIIIIVACDSGCYECTKTVCTNCYRAHYPIVGSNACTREYKTAFIFVLKIVIRQF